MNNRGYRQANAYYGGRYNPVNIYGGGRQGSEAISMYNPEAEAQFLQASMMRQERFDKATMASAQALSTIGGMDTYDAPELQSRLKSTQDKINKLVQDKYNGDYGAASNEIVNIIGGERAHPFYRFNKQKLEAAKTYQEDKRRLGANFMAAGDPMGVGFKDWQEGADFAYTSVNRQDIVNNSAAMFKSMANKLTSDPDFKSIEGGKFLERRLQHGFKGPEEAREFLNTDLGRSMVADLKESMPGLAGLDQGAVNDAILQGSYAGIGPSRFETKMDPGYMDEYKTASLAALRAKGQSAGYDFTSPATPARFPVKLKDLLESKSLSASPEINEFIAKTAKKHGLSNVKDYKDLIKLQNLNLLSSTKLGVQMVGKGQYGGMPSSEESEQFHKDLESLIGKSKDIGKVIDVFEKEYEQELSGTPFLNMESFDLRTVSLKERPQVEGMLKNLSTEIVNKLRTGQYEAVNRSHEKTLQEMKNPEFAKFGFIDATGELFITIKEKKGDTKTALGREAQDEVTLEVIDPTEKSMLLQTFARYSVDPNYTWGKRYLGFARGLLPDNTEE